MAKLSKAHQAVIDVYNAAERERLAYHHVLTAIVRGTGRWGTLERVGSVYDRGDSWVWQICFSPRMKDAVIMETFKSHTRQDETVRCFYLGDIANTYRGRSFDSGDPMAKMQALYWKAVEMDILERNKEAA